MRFSFSRIVGALAILLTLAGPSWAQQRIDQLGAAAAMSASDIIPDCQGCNNATPMVGLTPAQLITYLNTNLSLNASIITAGTLPIARGGTGITSFGTGVATALGQNVSGTGSICLSSGSACTGGGGSISVSGGGNTTTGVTTVAFGNGFVATPNGANTTSTVNLTVGDITKSGDYQVAAGDMGNALNLTGAHTLTLPAASSTIFAPGMTLAVVNSGSGNWTVTNSTGLAMTGLNSTTLPPGSSGSFVANANGTGIDFFPGMQPPTSTVLGGVIAGAGISISSAGVASLDLAHVNTFTASQSFAEVHGTAYAPTLSSNNYNAAVTDCGKTLLLPTGTTPTVVLPNINPGTGECTIKMVQMTSGTSLYTISAASGGTLVSANSYTHTAKQYAQIIVTLIVPSVSAATWALSGEGS